MRSATTHPFLYARMVADSDRTARPGDVVNVYDKNGALLGRGLFHPRSQIAVRLLAQGDVAVDEAFWRQRLSNAVQLRRAALRLDEVTDAYRLVHAEGDELSGLIVERFADTLVFELFSLGMFQRVGKIAQVLAELLGPPTALDRPDRAAAQWRLVVRADAEIERIEGFCAADFQPGQAGGAPGGAACADGADRAAGADGAERAGGLVGGAPVGALTIREHGVRYRVDPLGGQKTGFFCDQRENRLRFARLCRDAAVLDLCCYTAGFGLCAKVLGQAREVTSVDLDESALAVARENANLNQARLDFVHADAFIYTRQMIANQRRYDALVLDPPKLATSREEYDAALRKYSDLNALALQLVRPGGFFLTCSCSGLVSYDDFFGAVRHAARRTGRRLQMLDATGPGADHPVMINCPESAYLKALWFRVL